jgi:hypothetical protein
MNLNFFFIPVLSKLTDMLSNNLLKGSSVADEKTKTHYRYFHNGKFAHQRK